MGPATSESRMALLNATERVLRMEGYAAVSSRRIAEEAGLKQQLVYYYFHTMDELLLATFRRRTERALERLKATLESEHPLRALWEMHSELSVAGLSAEFMALANHHEGIRAEVVRYMEESRALEAEALSRLLPAPAMENSQLTPTALSLAISSITQTLAREHETGVKSGHADIRAFIHWCLDRLDPAARADCDHTASPPVRPE
jgi:AcrR family transcriptional regulator